MLNRTHRLGSIAVAIFIVFLMAGSFLVLVPIQLVVRPVAAVSPGPSISSVWGTGAGRNWSPFVGGALEIPTSSYPKVILSGVTTYPLAVDGMATSTSSTVLPLTTRLISMSCSQGLRLHPRSSHSTPLQQRMRLYTECTSMDEG